MKIPGVNTILYKPGNAVWRGERHPSDKLVRLIDEIPQKIASESFRDAAVWLMKMEEFALEPSQLMRLLFLRGQLLVETQGYDPAFQQYFDALRIAEEHGNLDSQITLTHLAGRMMYGLTKNQEALAYFQQAQALWNTRAAQLARPRIEPTVKFQERIGTVQWALGDFDSARAATTRALTLALYKSRGRRSNFLLRTTADALWSLALILRSQSDMQDGSDNLLKKAIKRMKQAESLYKKVETYMADEYRTSIGRICIQIAELYLDRAEMHLLRGNDGSASDMRKNALQYLEKALDVIDPANDKWGPLLVKLTQLRCSITIRSDRNVVQVSQTFQAEWERIKRKAEKEDTFVLAKAELLRGEWLLCLHRPEPARVHLLEVVIQLQNEGLGMATRAQRLLRRASVLT